MSYRNLPFADAAFRSRATMHPQRRRCSERNLRMTRQQETAGQARPHLPVRTQSIDSGVTNGPRDPETSERKISMAVALWAVTVLCTALFTMMGLPKVMGQGGWAARFATWGYPPWFVVLSA